MNNQASSSAHAVLSYMISNAMLRGKTGKTKIIIPLTDILQPAGEGPVMASDAEDVVLEVFIETNWSAAQNTELDVEMDEDLDVGEPT